jgi:hypothetical protein
VAKLERALALKTTGMISLSACGGTRDTRPAHFGGHRLAQFSAYFFLP